MFGGVVCGLVVVSAFDFSGTGFGVGRRDPLVIVSVGGCCYFYYEFITVCDRLYITEVDIEVEGDAFFPKIDSSKFKEVKREEKSKEPEDDAYHSMVIYEKI